jgi:hypothetical protein
VGILAAGNPNRFHEERSELAADIAKLARQLVPAVSISAT